MQNFIYAFIPASEGLAQVLLEADALRSRLQYPAVVMSTLASEEDVDLEGVSHVSRKAARTAMSGSSSSFLERLEQRERQHFMQHEDDRKRRREARGGETTDVDVD